MQAEDAATEAGDVALNYSSTFPRWNRYVIDRCRSG